MRGFELMLYVGPSAVRLIAGWLRRSCVWVNEIREWKGMIQLSASSVGVSVAGAVVGRDQGCSARGRGISHTPAEIP